MSIAMAILGGDCAIDASESRRVDGQGNVESDDWDKTFALTSHDCLAAHVGLLEFSGKTIVQHCEEIAASASAKDLGTLVLELGAGMAERLLQVPGAEVGFSHRRAEILIAGRSCILTGYIGLYSLTAHPDESTGRIDIDVSPWAHYVLSGDDSAREAVESLIRAEPADPRQMEAEVLKRLAERAIRSGIKRSGPNRDFPDITSCGGRPRLRSFSIQC